MRRLIGVFVLATPAFAAWTIVQGAQGSTSGTTGSPHLSTSTMSSPLTPGSTICVFVTNATQDTLSVADLAGNTYTDSGAGALPQNGSAARAEVFCANNTHNTANNVVTMTAGSPGYTTYWPRIIAVEILGGRTPYVIDAAVGNGNQSSGSGTNNVTTPPGTTSTSGDLILGSALTQNTATPAVGTGFTFILSTNAGTTMEYLVQSSAGSVSAAFNDSYGAGDQYAAVVVALRPNVTATNKSAGVPIIQEEE